MIRRITLDNFMSHSHSVIEPAEGLTVLVGPNNCGKSAVITALQTLCYNERGGFMVRHGESECRVTVETSEGHTLEWIRQKNRVRYIINGREVDRLKGSIPADLHQSLRLPLVESADGHDDFNIHFGEQKRPIFLLDQNGRQAAAFFASSSDAALLMEMQAAHKKRVTERRQDERTLSAEVDRFRRLLGTLQPVSDLSSRAEVLQDTHAELTASAQTLERLGEVAAQLLEDSTKVLHWQRSHDELQKLKSPPELQDTEDLAEQIKELDRATQSLHGQLARHGALIGLPEAPEMQPEAELDSLLQRIQASQAAAEFAARCDAALTSLTTAPVFHDVTAIEQAIEGIGQHEKTVDAFSATAGMLSQLSEPHAEEDSRELAELIDELTEASDAAQKFEVLRKQLADLDEPPAPRALESGVSLLESFDNARTLVETLTAELEAVERQRKDALARLFAWAEENPSCPVCGGPVDPDSLVACHEDSSKGTAS